MRYIYRRACSVSVETTVLETKRVHKRTSHRDAEGKGPFIPRVAAARDTPWREIVLINLVLG